MSEYELPNNIDHFFGKNAVLVEPDLTLQELPFAKEAEVLTDELIERQQMLAELPANVSEFDEIKNMQALQALPNYERQEAPPWIHESSLNVPVTKYKDNETSVFRNARDHTGVPQVISSRSSKAFASRETVIDNLPMVMLAPIALPFDIASRQFKGSTKWLSEDEWKEAAHYSPEKLDEYIDNRTTRQRYADILDNKVPGTDPLEFLLSRYTINANLIRDIVVMLRGALSMEQSYRISISVSMEVVKFSAGGGLSKLDSKIPLVMTESFAMLRGEGADYVHKFVSSLVEKFSKRLRESMERAIGSDVEVFFVNNHTTINVLTINPSIGQGYYVIADEKKEWLYNPPMNRCIFRCLEFGDERLAIDEAVRGRICEELKLTSIDAFPESKIDKLATILGLEDKNIALHVYSFGDEKLRQQPAKYPRSNRTIKGKKIISIIRVFGKEKKKVSSHALLIHPQHLKQTLAELTRNDLQFINEEKTQSVAEMRTAMNYTQYLHLHDRDKPADTTPSYSYDYRNIWLYDFETFPRGEKKNHHIYQSNLLCLHEIYDQIRSPRTFISEHDGPRFYLRPANIIKKLVYTSYGIDAIEPFINKLDEIVERTTKRVYERLSLQFAIQNTPAAHKKAEENAKYLIAKKLCIRQHKQLIIGHNSAKYDTYAMLQASDRFVAGMTGNPVIANGYISLEYKDVIEFIDFYKFMPTSLANVCDTMKIPKDYSKGKMPYDFATESTLYYKGIIPEAKFWKNVEFTINPEKEHYGIDPAWLEEAGVRDPADFDMERHVTNYAKLDVIALGVAVHRYSYGMWKVTLSPHTNRGLYAFDYLTLPMLAGAFGMRDVNFEQPDEMKVYVTKNFFVDKYVREPGIGGLVTVNNSHYEAPWFKKYKEASDANDLCTMMEILEEAEKTSEFYDCIDVTSLYPSSMANAKFPVGEPKFAEDDQLEMYCQWINDFAQGKRQDRPKHFIAEVDIRFTKEGRAGVRPLLPSKFKNGSTVYDFYDKNNFKVCSVDLFEALHYNKAYITKVHSILIWPEERAIFKDVIWALFRKRQEAKKAGNDVMSELLKLMMNSLYGKMIQKVHLEKKMLVTNREALDILYERGQLGTTMQLIGDDVLGCKMLVDQVISEDTATFGELNKLVNRCPHLGVFILAYSKAIMNRARNVIGGFDRIVDAYQDTDSFYVHHRDYDVLRYDGVAADGKPKHRLSPFKDEQGNQLHWVNPDPDPNNAVLTQFHDDTDGKVIKPMICNFWAAAAKVKSIEYACIEPRKEKKVWQDDGIFTDKYGVSIPTAKKMVGTGKFTEARPVLKFKGSFKGFKAKDDPVNPAYSNWAAKVISMLKHGIEQEPDVTRLCPNLIKAMVPGPDRTIYTIEYGQFKKDTRTGKGVSSITTKKQIGQSIWQGRLCHEDTLHWHAFGSSFNTEEDNIAHLQHLAELKPRGSWHYSSWQS